MKSVVFRSLEKELKEEWIALWENSIVANYVNSPHWFSSVIDSFGYDDYILIALYEKKKLVGVAGLIKEKRYGISVYTVPPGDFVCGLPFLVDLADKRAISTLVDELIKNGPILLDNVPESVVTLLTKRKVEIQAIPYSINFYSYLKKDEQGKVIISNKKQFLRKVKHIENKFTLKIFHGDSEEAFTIAFQIDKKSRKEIRGYNAFSGATVQQFYKSLGANFKENFYTHILYFEDTPILYEMGFRIGSTYFGSQIAFNEEYKSFTPGKVFLIKLAESLIGENIQQINFGSGESHVKRLFTEDYMQLYNVVISKSLFIRFYLTTLYKIRARIFASFKKHIRSYAFYRRMKKMLRI